MNRPSNKFPSVEILGSKVQLPKLLEVIDEIETWIRTPHPTPRRITVTGFHGLYVAYNNPKLRQILGSADLWIPDGIAPVWLARGYGLKHVHRIPGADLMRAFFARASTNGFSSYFFGDTPEVLEALIQNISLEFPGAKIAGFFSPPFRKPTQKEDESQIEAINSAKPDVLWVALGLPRQDEWIYERLERLKVPVAIGVGAAFGFLAGKVKRAPALLGDHGLEWAWRLVMEPKKMWRRDLKDGPGFVYAAGKEFFQKKIAQIVKS